MEAQGNVSISANILKPGVRSSYGNGWRQMWKNFLELFLILIITIVIGGVGGGIGQAGGFLAFISVIYGLLISNPVNYGMNFAYLRTARGDKVEIKDMFAAFQNYWNAVLAALLVGIIVAIGFILIIVPGIIFACKLVFTPYLVVDRKMEVIEAVKTSWRMTNGYAWKVFLMGLLAILIGIAGLICFGVGIIIAIMWITLAFASLYHAVSSQVDAGLEGSAI